MTRSAFLEDFSQPGSSAGQKSAQNTPGLDGNAGKKAFDEGYNCGWNDGVSSKEDAEARTREELSSALQELNFTYFEARQHAVSSVRPILQAMADAVLPKLASESLGDRVAELLAEMANTIEPSATIMCAPGSVEMLQQLVTEHLKFKIEIVPEPTFTPAQAVLHLDDSQIRVDLDATIAAIHRSIDEFYMTDTVTDKNKEASSA